MRPALAQCLAPSDPQPKRTISGIERLDRASVGCVSYPQGQEKWCENILLAPEQVGCYIQSESKRSRSEFKKSGS